MAKVTSLKDSSLQEITAQSISLDMQAVAPNINTTRLSEDVVIKIIERLGEVMGLPSTHSFIAVALLFLKGAASAGAPNSLEVSVKDAENSLVTIQKYDLINSYSRITGNKFIRRMAEAMAVNIGKFAESKGLNGDLAVKINTSLVAKGEPPLSMKEKAWASSFSQELLNLEELAGPRLPALLAMDLQTRVAKKQQEKHKTKESIALRDMNKKSPKNSEEKKAPDQRARQPKPKH